MNSYSKQSSLLPRRAGNAMRPLLILSAALLFWPLAASRTYAQETVLLEESFEDTDFASRTWYDGGEMSIDYSTHIEGSGASGIFKWESAGDTSPSNRIGRAPIAPVEGLTLSFHVRFSDDWEWTNRGWHPHFMHFCTNHDGRLVGPAYTHLTIYIEPVDGKLRFGIQDGVNLDLNNLNRNLVG
ncbi:MAG: hypothetical protein U9N45_04115, partial [Gemmatimonadota bacterium]|nr:hypothetical protein [Gemmatimonadota bacterium]